MTSLYTAPPADLTSEVTLNGNNAMTGHNTFAGTTDLNGPTNVNGNAVFTGTVTVPAASLPESAVANLTTDLASKATDSLVVHLAGTETLTGNKTMQGTTAFTGNVGFYSTAPVAQPAGTTDVLASLVTLGLRAASSNPPLNLGSGNLTAGAAILGTTPATTGQVRLSNNSTITARNAANSADIDLLLLTAADTTTLKGGTLSLITTAANAISFAPNNVTAAQVTTSAFRLIDGFNIQIGTTNGSQIGTATNQPIGFYGATPTTQIAGSTDVLAGLVTLGLRAASSNPPLNLGTNQITAGTLLSPAGTVLIIGSSSTNTLRLRTNNTDRITLDGSTGTATLSDAVNLILGSTTGTQIGTATTQKLGFFGATAVVQEAGTNDVLASLVTLGLRAASSNPPLNMGTGLLTCGQLSMSPTNTGNVPVTVNAPTGISVNCFDVQINGTSKFKIGSGGGATFAIPMAFADAVSISVGTATGTKIGTATNQKLGFFNATPIVQPAAITLPAATASTNVTPFGYTTAAQADAVVTAVRALINQLGATGGGLGLFA